MQSAEYFPALSFVKNTVCLPKSKWYPKSKGKVDVVNLSDKVKFLDLLVGYTSLAKVGQCYEKNESNIHNTALNSMHLS